MEHPKGQGNDRRKDTENWESCYLTIMKTFLTLILFVLAVQKLDGQNFSKTFSDYEGNVGMNVAILSDGYLIVGGGWSDSLDGWQGYKCLKTDFQGNLQFIKVYGLKQSNFYTGEASCLKMTIDGNYIFAGSVIDSATGLSDALIVKLNNNGDTIWTKIVSGVRRDVFKDIDVYNDGSMMAVGFTNSTGNINGNLYAVRFNQSGTIIWEKNYGGSGLEEAFSVKVTPDGGFIAAGVTDSYGPNLRNAWIIKADQTGDLQWQKTFGTNGDDLMAKIALSQDGGYYLYAAFDSSFGNGPDPTDNVIIKLNSQGNVVWRVDMLADDERVINSLIEFGSFLSFVGITKESESGNYSGWLVKMDLSGAIVWERVYEYSQLNPVAWFNDLKITNDNGYIITGTANNPGTIFANRQDFWLVKVDSNGCLYPTAACVTGIKDVQMESVNIYPNPTTGTITVNLPNNVLAAELVLINLMGQRVLTAFITDGQGKVDVGDLPSGVYIYHIEQDGKALNGKLVVE